MKFLDLFTEFCSQNIQIERLDPPSSSNLSQINPSSGLPMINNNFDIGGNSFGCNPLSTMNNPSINGFSNDFFSSGNNH